MGIKATLALLLAAGTALGGCNTTSPPGPTATTVSDLPPDYRNLILHRARAEFVDPYSIRDGAISQPIPGQTLLGTAVSICVRANAKNRMGAYTGLRAMAYTFRAGQLTVSDHQFSAITCAAAVYEPFPEIESAAQADAAKR